MTWRELCFLHWRLDPSALEPLLPEGLAPDVHDGSAWLGIVPFRVAGVAPRGVLRGTVSAQFDEVDVRTYVTVDDRPGIWFFSLDASDAIIVRFCRAVFHLPYVDARIEVERDVETIGFESARTYPGAGVAGLRARYRPAGPVEAPAPGTLEHFLVERDSLYSSWGSRLYRQEIQHDPWPLQPAVAELELNTMARPLGLDLDDEPALAHYADALDVRARPPGRLA
jgi:uncharacterized protein YqjF (DUF2071 family)